MPIVFGPTQSILSGASATAAAYTLGQTNSQAGLTVDKGRPVTGTLGARLVALRIYATGGGLGTIVVNTPRPGWINVPGDATNAGTVPGTTGASFINRPSVAAAAMSNFDSASRALYGVITPPTGASVIPCQSLFVNITVGTTTLTGLTIDARVGYEMSGPYSTEAAQSAW